MVIGTETAATLVWKHRDHLTAPNQTNLPLTPQWANLSCTSHLIVTKQRTREPRSTANSRKGMEWEFLPASGPTLSRYQRWAPHPHSPFLPPTFFFKPNWECGLHFALL